jgi:hypothetical protein
MAFNVTFNNISAIIVAVSFIGGWRKVENPEKTTDQDGPFSLDAISLKTYNMIYKKS